MSNFPKKPGVYVIRCLSNDKCYVGQSVNLNRRICSQKYFLKKPILDVKQVNKHLWSAVQEEGFENFEIQILQVAENGENLQDIEHYWMVQLNSVYPSGFNLRQDFKGKYICHEETKKVIGKDGVKNPNYGNRWSEDQRKQMSDFAKKRHASGEFYNEEWRKKQGLASFKFWQKNPDIKDQMRKKVSDKNTVYEIHQFLPTGELIKIWTKMQNIIDENPQFKTSGIYKNTYGKSKTYKGFVWKRIKK